MKRFLFVAYNKTTASMIMRAVRVSEHLNKLGYTSSCVTHDQIHKAQLDKNTICIIVKVIYPHIIELARKRGATLVLDQVDSWFWNNLNHPWDIVIANHGIHAMKIAETYKGKIVIIPHLHTNLHRKRKTIEHIKTLGYIGMPQQFCMTDEMTSFCKLRNLNWYQATGATADKVEEETMKLDLGIVYVDETMEQHGLKYENTINFKPATKLVNQFSYGIPCIFSRYRSFINLCRNDKDLSSLIATSRADIIAKADELLTNKVKFNRISDKCYSIAEEFHMDNVKKFYVDNLQD